MFAVSFGSYEFGKKFNRNVVAIFSIKNTSYPERIISLQTAAMTLDFHPACPALLAIGLDNGNVLVFDVRTKND